MEPFHDARVNLFRGNTLEHGDPPDVALVFGGDGSVHRVLASLAYSRTPLLVVPTGSANDFAHCLGIANPGAALRAWRRYLDRGDNVCCIDLGAVRPIGAAEPAEAERLDSMTFADSEGRFAPPTSPLAPVILRHHLYRAEESAEQQRMIYFSGIAALGLDSQTHPLVNRMPGWLRRHGGYLLAALRAMARYHPPTLRMYSYDLRDDEIRMECDVLMAAIGNAPQCAGGMKVLPKAKLDDGQLDLCFVPSMSRSRVLRYFHRIYSGTHLRLPEVTYFRARQVFLESPEPVAIYADGEYLCCTPAEISVAPRALRVIVP